MNTVLKFLQRQRFVLEALAIILISGAVGFLVFFTDRLVGPADSGAPVVINEVYPAFCQRNPAFPGEPKAAKWLCPMPEAPEPYQWFELYNRTGNWQVLEDWSVEMEAGSPQALPRLVLPPYGYAVVAASEEHFLAEHPDFPGIVVFLPRWPGLGQGFLVLRNAQGEVVDAVNWKKVETPPAEVKLWDAPALGMGAPWIFDAQRNIQADHSLERRPVGIDRNLPADFIRQPFPSPGTVHEPSATWPAYLLLTDWTNVASVAAGVLLWIAFIYVALIARRFEALTQQRTFWQAMLFAPSGILFYVVVQSIGFRTRGSMTVDEQWWSFVILFISALLCAALVFLFRQRARKILEG